MSDPPSPRSLPMVSGDAARIAVEAPLGPQRVQLFCLPYQHLRLSSLSTAHLATLLRSRGFECREVYAHFELARLMGARRYHEITDGADGLSGELLFAEALHGEIQGIEPSKKLTRLFGRPDDRRRVIRELERYCLEALERDQPTLVGVSTSFNQLSAGLWLARLVKQNSKARVVLGGAACAEPMGQRIVAAYPDVDFVVSGYGEHPLLALTRGEDLERGVLSSSERVDLNQLPLPDYSAFLEQAGKFADDRRLMLTFESSRGCWWGQVNHCTFCGLNGVEMAFNQKTSERVVEEIRELWSLYGRNLFATDAILSRDHLKHAVPKLAEYSDGPRLFYEVKANMTQTDVLNLRRANVMGLQPGIESLSTHLLRLLKKGINTIRNLALLKWCRERDIAITWNQLCGIPGERIEDYDAQIALMSNIPQLPPPERANPVRIDRYSPYFKSFREFGWESIEPSREYGLLHPELGDEALREIAYHFWGVGGASSASYFERFDAAVQKWRERNERGEGLFLDPEQGLVRNGPDNAVSYPTEGLLGRVLEMTHEVTAISRVLAEVGCDRDVLSELERHGILYIEGESVLNLAVRTVPPEELALAD